MKRSMAVQALVGALLAGSVLWAGCKKSEDPVTVATTADTGPAAPTPAPTPSVTATETPSAAPTAAPPPVATAPAAKKGESIDACCNALKAIQKSGKTAAAKSKAAAASAVCPGIAKLVKDGQTPRSSGLSQIRSALTGFDVPGECK